MRLFKHGGLTFVFIRNENPFDILQLAAIERELAQASPMVFGKVALRVIDNPNNLKLQLVAFIPTNKHIPVKDMKTLTERALEPYRLNIRVFTRPTDPVTIDGLLALRRLKM